MDYLNYILAVLVIGLVCFTAIRLVARKDNSQSLQRYKDKQQAMAAAKKAALSRSSKRTARTKAGTKSKAASLHPALKREIQHVRTPWGWPNHQASGEAELGLSGAMQSLTDRLIREKRLVRTQSNDPRVSGSVRALLEDRYGRVNKQSINTIEYEKVKKPLLRNPSDPHDQMDNFGASEAERIREKLRHVAAMNKSDAHSGNEDSELRYVEKKNLKQPWGW